MAGPNPFDADTQAQPPNRQPGEIEQAVGRGEGNAIIGADRVRQAALFKQALEGSKSGLLGIRFHGFAQQQIARSMIGDRQWITVAPIAEHELAFVVGAPQCVGVQAL
jgi:hypothetical protein